MEANGRTQWCEGIMGRQVKMAVGGLDRGSLGELITLRMFEKINYFINFTFKSMSYKHISWSHPLHEVRS